MNRSVVLCGLGRVGWRVLDFLRAAGWQVRVVDLHADPADPRLEGVELIQGDCRSPKILQRANITEAFGVVIVTSDDLVNVTTALLIRRLNSEARIAVRMFNQNLITRLGTAVRNTVALSVSALTAPFIALAAITGDSLAAFKIDQTPQQFVEMTITPESRFFQRRLDDLISETRVLIIGHAPASGPYTLFQRVDGSRKLASGDRLVICGNPQAIHGVVGSADDGALEGVLWAGAIRRFSRTLRETLATVDLPVRIAACTLFFTLLLSSAVFRFGIGTTWQEGVYQTVSIITTASELHGEGQEPWVKVFLSVLKLLGVALIAAFTALFTNYLLKARLGVAFETRLIPDGGHVVVCGLGNIGFRCVEELVRLGCQVVAVEKSTDNPFAATVRRMGVAVVIGDSTVSEVLRQARADTARTVIAATSTELVNLEIALLVQEMNREQRVVVRLIDPEFAQAARDAANIRLAFSAPALAAPAFAAALYGDRVLSLASLGGRSLVVVELLCSELESHFVQRSLMELATDYHFLPLGLGEQPPFAESETPWDHRIRSGDRLIVALEVADLERLLRRETPPKNCTVVIDDYPVTALEELAVLVRLARNCTAEESKQLISQKPCTLVEGVSRGQAEEWYSRLRRERATARIVTPT